MLHEAAFFGQTWSHPPCSTTPDGFDAFSTKTVCIQAGRQWDNPAQRVSGGSMGAQNGLHCQAAADGCRGLLARSSHNLLPLLLDQHIQRHAFQLRPAVERRQLDDAGCLHHLCLQLACSTHSRHSAESAGTSTLATLRIGHPHLQTPHKCLCHATPCRVRKAAGRRGGGWGQLWHETTCWDHVLLL